MTFSNDLLHAQEHIKHTRAKRKEKTQKASVSLLRLYLTYIYIHTYSIFILLLFYLIKILECEYFPVSVLFYDSKLNIYVLWTKQDI